MILKMRPSPTHRFKYVSMISNFKCNEQGVWSARNDVISIVQINGWTDNRRARTLYRNYPGRNTVATAAEHYTPVRAIEAVGDPSDGIAIWDRRSSERIPFLGD